MPHLARVIGAWLAGIYDNDRPVQRSALESFTTVFSTEEKRNNVWKIYQSSTLDFIDDVVLHQTPLTLSDERTVKRDDAEAKYARVVGASLMLLNRILGMMWSTPTCLEDATDTEPTGNSPDDDLQKGLPEIQNLLSSKSLWALCSHEDPFVRRSIYIVLRSTVSREPGWIDWKLVSSAIIGKSLSISQLTSSSELSETLLIMTSSRPQVWTDDYTSKTSASKRLRQYIQKGSQGGLANFWSNLDKLLRLIPREILAGADKTSADETINLSSASALTEAFQEGLNSREEPRPNVSTGWKSYIRVGAWLGILLPQDQRAEFVKQRLSPLVAHYVRPSTETAQWTLPAPSAQDICAQFLLTLISHEQSHQLEPLWTKLSDGLLDAVKLSSPEQSKDFRSSQDAVCAEAQRLFGLEPAVLSMVRDSESELQAQGIFEQSNLFLLESCLEILRSRNGKPYGAAGVIEECVRNMPSVAKGSQELIKFLNEDVPELLFSPSGDRLVGAVMACRTWDGFASSFENVVEKAMDLEPEQSNVHILLTLLSSLDFNEMSDKTKLTSLVMSALDKACRGSSSHWSIIASVLQNQTSRGELMDRIFLSIVDVLSQEDRALDVLHGLSSLGKTVPSAIKDFQNGPNGSKLAGKLLYLTESPSEEVASLTESLIRSFKETVVGDSSAESKIEILRHELSHASEGSLS